MNNNINSMRKITTLAIALVFWLLAGHSTACFSHQPDLLKIQTPTPTPTNSKSENKIFTEFVNEEGWTVPLPTSANKHSVNIVQLSTTDKQNVNVSISSFIGLNDFRFKYGSINSEQKEYLSLDELRLVSLKEFRVGRNVFSYVIMAEKLTSKEHNFGSHPFLYKILDKDGDGKFETLFPGDSDNLVPAWVNRN
jgi:hypothetical protein